MANKSEQKGTSNAIRKVLKAAGVQLTVADILDALPSRIETSASSVGAICRQRASAGEFTSGVEGGRCVYGINAEWDGVSRVSQAALASNKPSGTVAGGQRVLDVARAIGESVDDDVRVVERKHDPLAAACRPLGLRDRIQAIATDLKDAIGDACDEELPHSVIKALVAADGATQLALRKLAA